MPNYTENLHLVKPLQSEQYNIDVFNSNADKIDQFAGQVPARALTADKLTTGAKINGVNFKGDADITIYDETKANIDLLNLTSTGENHFLNKRQITNCILEAPNGVASYSGSTVTIYSGIKYLTGIGRNSDLSLKNAEYTTESEKTLTFSPVQDGFAYVYLLNGNPYYCHVREVYFIDNSPSVEAPTAKSGNNQLWFDLWDNKIYHSSYGSTEWVKQTDCIIIGKAYFPSESSSTIVDFRNNLPVRLIKASDKPDVCAWPMPNGKQIDLVFGASGSTYTAPATGWVSANIINITQAGYLYLYCNGYSDERRIYNNGVALTTTIPVRKGSTITLRYDANGTKQLKFIYAIGEEM